MEESNIRKIWYSNQWYFSVIDAVADMMNTDHQHAKNYYHVFKNRLRKNGENTPPIQQLKAQSSDGKIYLTDFTTYEGIQLLRERLRPNIRNQHSRLEIRKDDEVAHFHPFVQAYLERLDFQIQHHVHLSSGNIIDFIARSANATYVIECKPRLVKSTLYAAIGQVLCYRNEYHSKATPVIASYSTSLTDYARRSCDELGIQIIEI